VYKNEAGIDKLLIIAKEAAMLGANSLRRNDIILKSVQYEKSHDVKLQADKIAENQIVSFLKAETDIEIISEEMWEASPLEINEDSSDFLWVIDPLDGSYNFLHDIPFYCISIALWEGRKAPVLGVIYNFANNELFHGVVGRGSWLNNMRINMANKKDISKAILCTGFPVNMDFSNQNLIEFSEKIKSWGKIRLFGSAGLSLAYVASGRVDAYQERDIMFWDVAAGVSLVKAAGGKVDFKFSGEGDLRMKVLATNNYLKLEDK
jgi:myo-inositol-1(or 4)-monophosphatase